MPQRIEAERFEFGHQLSANLQGLTRFGIIVTRVQKKRPRRVVIVLGILMILVVGAVLAYRVSDPYRGLPPLKLPSPGITDQQARQVRPGMRNHRVFAILGGRSTWSDNGLGALAVGGFDTEICYQYYVRSSEIAHPPKVESEVAWWNVCFDAAGTVTGVERRDAVDR
jgi:hypothetical protein